MTPEAPLVTYEHYYRNRLFRWKNRALFDDQGTLKEFFTVGEDITDERIAADKLRTSEVRSRALVEAIPDSMFRYNKDGHCLDAEIIDASRLTEKGRFLYQSGKLIGSKITDIYEPGNAQIIIEGIRLALETGKRQIIKYHYLLEGQELFFESRIVPTGLDEVVSIVRDVTDQDKNEEALHYQFQFENMVAQISSNFVNIPAEQIDDALIHALKLSGEFFGADRSYLFRFSEDGAYMNNTHEWCAEGIIPQKGRYANYPVNTSPWWSEQIKTREYVQVADVEAMPAVLEKDKAEFQEEQIQSFLTIPIYKDAELFGFFGFDAVKEKKSWSEQQIALLGVVAEIIGAAIIKHETEEALKDSEERYRDILATIEEAYYETDLAGNITFFNQAGLRLFGDYTPEEALNISYKELYINPEDAYKVYHRVFLTGKPDRGLVMEMIRKDGSKYFGEISVTVIKDKGGGYYRL